jgi:RNA polymerase sigma-70 factor (ECF subfamily)
MTDSALPVDGLASRGFVSPRRVVPLSSPDAAPAADARPDEPSDGELARHVARRDGSSRQALERLFLRHAEPLARFLARWLRSETEAEDLVHDAFLRVAEKAGTYRGESPFRTWLFALALNLARGRRRREALADQVHDAVAAERSAPQAAHDPAWLSQRRETWARVEAAIAALAEAERETFLLYWFGELSYAEISALQGISVAAAKVRVHRALARLAESLGTE